jgi:hypothetical protein
VLVVHLDSRHYLWYEKLIPVVILCVYVRTGPGIVVSQRHDSLMSSSLSSIGSSVQSSDNSQRAPTVGGAVSHASIPSSPYEYDIPSGRDVTSAGRQLSSCAVLGQSSHSVHSTPEHQSAGILRQHVARDSSMPELRETANSCAHASNNNMNSVDPMRQMLNMKMEYQSRLQQDSLLLQPPHPLPGQTLMTGVMPRYEDMIAAQPRQAVVDFNGQAQFDGDAAVQRQDMYRDQWSTARAGNREQWAGRRECPPTGRPHMAPAAPCYAPNISNIPCYNADGRGIHLPQQSPVANNLLTQQHQQPAGNVAAMQHVANNNTISHQHAVNMSAIQQQQATGGLPHTGNISAMHTGNMQQSDHPPSNMPMWPRMSRAEPHQQWPGHQPISYPGVTQFRPAGWQQQCSPRHGLPASHHGHGQMAYQHQPRPGVSDFDVRQAVQPTTPLSPQQGYQHQPNITVGPDQCGNTMQASPQVARHGMGSHQAGYPSHQQQPRVLPGHHSPHLRAYATPGYSQMSPGLVSPGMPVSSPVPPPPRVPEHASCMQSAGQQQGANVVSDCSQVTSTTDTKGSQTDGWLEPGLLPSLNSLLTDNLLENIIADNLSSISFETWSGAESRPHRPVAASGTRSVGSSYLDTSNMVVSDMSTSLLQLAGESAHV